MQIFIGQSVNQEISKDLHWYFIFNLGTLFKQYNQVTNSDITNPNFHEFLNHLE